MFALDLFNTDHERRLAEGAVDQLEQRRIDDLAMKMDDLVARAKEPAYKKNPAALAALMKEFQKCKAERDSYYMVRNETMGYGSLVGEEDDPYAQLRKDAAAGYSKSLDNLNKPQSQKSFMAQVGDKQIGMVKGAWKGLTGKIEEVEKNQDIVDKKAKMARLNQPGKVGSDAVTPQQRINPNPDKGIIGHAADWLRGKGGPGKEGPTYESELAEQDEELAQQELGGGYGVYKELLSAWNEKKPYVIVPMPGGQNLSITRNQIFNVLYALKNMNDNKFKKTIANAFSNLDKFMVWSNSIKRYQLPKEKPQSPPGQMKLFKEAGQKKNSDKAVAPQSPEVDRYLTKVRRASPNATSDLEAIAKDELEKQARVNKNIDDLEQVNARQDAALKKAMTLDRQQGNEIDDVERQINQLSQRVQSIKTAKPVAGQSPRAEPQVATPAVEPTSTAPKVKSDKPKDQPTTVNIPQPIYIAEPEKLPQKDQEIYTQVKNLETELKNKIDSMATWNKVAQKDDESRNELEMLRKDMERTKRELNRKIKSLQKSGANIQQTEPSQQKELPLGTTQSRNYISGLRKQLGQTVGNRIPSVIPAAPEDDIQNIISPEKFAQLGNLERQTAESATNNLKEGQRLHLGDPIIVTAPNEFEGATGEIYEFSPSGKFIIVDLYNHGKHSMHLSDVAYNEYADNEEVDEGWSDAMVARRTGTPRTPYSVYIKGKKWKDFENDDHAEAVANKLRAKFKAEGRDPSVITIAPTNISEGQPQELINRYLAIDAENDVDAVRSAIQSISRDPALGANSKTRLLGQIGMIIKKHRLPIGRSYYTYMQKYMEDINETALNPKDPTDDYEAKRRALHDLSLNKEVDQQAVLQRRLDLDREAKSKGLAETVTNVKAGMAEIYRRLAPKIERHRDSFLAGQLYDELENYAELHGAEGEFKRMMSTARNRAHMEYDTNPGGFQNWFWFLPFEDQDVTEGLMKEPTNRKEYLDQRDKLFRMMAVDSNPANKQIIKQALQDLEARYGHLKKAVKEEYNTGSEAVEIAIIKRILVAHTDLIMKFGLDKVTQAIEEVAYNVGDVDEIGTSDVSAYVHQVKQILGVPEELDEKWSQKYKSSINCANPKGFSQRAHCAGKKK